MKRSTKKHPEKILGCFFMTIAPDTFSTSLQPYIAVYKKNGHSIYYDFSDYVPAGNTLRNTFSIISHLPL